MRALILAAGAGGRSRSFERHRPSCMFELGDRTLLAAQAEALLSRDIRSITAITGFGHESVRASGVETLHNSQWKETNILASLVLGWDRGEDLVVTYGDILFDPALLDALVCSPHDVTLLHDTLWQTPYAHRLDKTPASAEMVISGNLAQVELIGKHLPFPDTISGEFVGLLRLKGKGLEALRTLYRKLQGRQATHPLQRARNLQVAALTDLLQEYIDEGGLVHSLPVKRGWVEIDSIMDYERAKVMAAREGVLSLLK
ncbi:MAG: NTP transferase domain-containing protein [Planctomycetota bacterium]